MVWRLAFSVWRFVFAVWCLRFGVYGLVLGVMVFGTLVAEAGGRLRHALRRDGFNSTVFIAV